MTLDWIAICGGAAAVCTTGSFLPQVIKTVQTRSTEDFSWPYLVLFSVGVALWLVYGVMRHDVAVIAANGITLLLMLVIVAVKMMDRD